MSKSYYITIVLVNIITTSLLFMGSDISVIYDGNAVLGIVAVVIIISVIL